MLFNSLTFPIFFVLVYVAYLLARRSLGAQNLILLVASYIFYGAWDWRFLGLLGGSTVANYGIGLWLQRERYERSRYAIVVGGITLNLFLIGVFKYFDFFASNLVALADLCGVRLGYTAVNIVLPVGISFFTFQAISYLVDVYRYDIEATRNFIDFALFKSFFPQLVAGPIERAKHLLPQIVRSRTISFDDIATGSWCILYGYFLKIFIADNLGPIADQAFSTQAPAVGASALLGVYAFAFQIFGDFAGYTSIAIGIARLMGFHLTINFLYPYFVTNPRDFWRNWHISLSIWLRDYVYISLGGSRGTQARTYGNLLLTMLLGGLWHGAAWTFVIWGAYQGALLVVHRAAEPYLKAIPVPRVLNSAWWVVRVFVMFQITCVGWLIFRARSMEQVSHMMSSIVTNFSAPPAAAYEASEILFFTAPLLAINALQMRSGSGGSWSVLELKWQPRLAIIVGLYLLIVAWGQFGSRQFIYFQF